MDFETNDINFACCLGLLVLGLIVFRAISSLVFCSCEYVSRVFRWSLEVSLV